MVTPLLDLPNGGTLTFWVSAQDAQYPTEHYAVYASTTGNAAVNFTNALLEETTTAKTDTAPETPRGTGDRGTWYEKTVQLPAGTKYVAFRHFNSTDMFRTNIDEVKIEGATKRDDSYTYTVYRDGVKIKDGLTETTYRNAGMSAQAHECCVEVKYADGVSPKVCVNYIPDGVADVTAQKPYTLTVVGKTITVTCQGEAMIYDMNGRRLAAGRNTVVYTAQAGYYAVMIVVDGKSYVEKLAIK